MARQSSSGKHWPRIGIAAGVLLVLVCGTFVGGIYWVQAYLRGTEFLAHITRLTGDTFQAEAHYEPLKWNGSSAYSEQATLNGKPGSAVQRLDARQVRADLNWRAMFGGAWRVEEISITRMEADFQLVGGPARDPSGPAAASPMSGLASLLPRRFELGGVTVARADVAFAPVRATDVALKIRSEGSGWTIEGSGGKLAVPKCPTMDLVEFQAREKSGDYFLTKCALRLGGSGEVSASGQSGKSSILRLSWNSVKAENILDAEWNKRLHGILAGSAEMEFPGPTRGTFMLSDGRVENVPVLARIADFTGNPSYRRMPLQEMSAEFLHDAGKLKLSNCVVESKGLLRLEGTAEIGANRSITGNFRIGVTPQSLQWLPGSRERIFTVVRNGYLWADLTIGGTLENPTEDLSARLASAMGEEVIQRGTDIINNVPGAASEGIKGVLDLLLPQ